MDTDIWILFVVLIALIIGGGYFAASETAFASVNPMRIKHRSDEGEKRAKYAEYILNHFNKALSTLLIGNNLMHIGTASIATYIVTKTWGEGYTAYSTLITTAVVFLVSEMIPKQFAKDCPESTALFFAKSLYWLMKILAPFSAIFDALSNFISSLFKAESAPSVTEDELIEIIDSLAETEEDGPQRSELLHSALEFDETTAKDIMTPIEHLVSIEEYTEPLKVLEIIKNTPYSRLPVYKKQKDHLIGVLDTRQYIKTYLSRKKPVSVKKAMHKVLLVPENILIDDLFDQMTQSRTHMCIVTDENEKTTGVVTMEDIMEELVGEIFDEQDASFSDDDFLKEVEE